MDSKAILVEAVKANTELPADLRKHVGEARAVEGHQYDESYIEFLDTQIRLSPRGPDWTERLKRRRAALLPFCGVTLVRGNVRAGNTDFTIEVHPETLAVVHWEAYVIGVDGLSFTGAANGNS